MIIGVIPHKVCDKERGVSMDVGIISRKTAEFLKSIGFPAGYRKNSE